MSLDVPPSLQSPPRTKFRPLASRPGLWRFITMLLSAGLAGTPFLVMAVAVVKQVLPSASAGALIGSLSEWLTLPVGCTLILAIPVTLVFKRFARHPDVDRGQVCMRLCVALQLLVAPAFWHGTQATSDHEVQVYLCLIASAAAYVVGLTLGLIGWGRFALYMWPPASTAPTSD